MHLIFEQECALAMETVLLIIGVYCAAVAAEEAGSVALWRRFFRSASILLALSQICLVKDG